MQQASGSLPQVPQPPQPPQQLVVPLTAVPQTAAEVRAIRIKIDDMRESLQDFAERRNSVAGNLRRADIDARPGYQARLDNLDANINLLQNQITQATLALSQAPASAMVGGTETRMIMPPMPGGPRDAVQIISVIGSFLVVLSIIGFVRAVVTRRMERSSSRAIADPETGNQLRQLQQSVDSIAIEVERISEGQRFVTKALAERAPEQLGR